MAETLPNFAKSLHERCEAIRLQFAGLSERLEPACRPSDPSTSEEKPARNSTGSLLTRNSTGSLLTQLRDCDDILASCSAVITDIDERLEL